MASDDILKVLASHGFHFSPKRSAKWRGAEGAGLVDGLPSFGTCHAIATDGVHMIVIHGNGSTVIEVHERNWRLLKPDNTPAKKTETEKAPMDKSAAALTRLLADLS